LALPRAAVVISQLLVIGIISKRYNYLYMADTLGHLGLASLSSTGGQKRCPDVSALANISSHTTGHVMVGREELASVTMRCFTNVRHRLNSCPRTCICCTSLIFFGAALRSFNKFLRFILPYTLPSSSCRASLWFWLVKMTFCHPFPQSQTVLV
jgi:hypothetical protein